MPIPLQQSFCYKNLNFAVLKPLQILFSDADVLVLNKPPGITVIPDRQNTASLQQIAEAQFGSLFIVHRIDKDTSGVIVFARNAAAHRHLSMQFEAHTVIKKYSALLKGRMTDTEIVIDKPIGKHPRKSNVMVIDRNGKSAHTVCKPVEIFMRNTYAEISISTGRTHQIRVHMQHAGYPLLVDPVYGNAQAFFLSQIKRNYKIAIEEKPIMQRLSLHADSITFLHPVSGKQFTVHAPLPDDFLLVLKMLRKYDMPL